MFCQECGYKHSDTAKFCPRCGTRIERDEPVQPTAAPPPTQPETVTQTQPEAPSSTQPEVVTQTQPERQLFYHESILNRASVPPDDPEEPALRLQEPDEPEEPQAGVAALPDDAFFATSDCEEPASEAPVSEEPAADETGDPYSIWKAMIGENAGAYYIPEFEMIAAGESSFNWMAFFFGGVLMLYRRLYAYFLRCYFPLIVFLFTGCFVMMVGISTLEPIYIITGSALCGLTALYWFIVSFSVGGNFNRTYFKHLQKRVLQREAAGFAAEDTRAETSLFPVVLFFVCMVLALLCIQYFGMQMGLDLLGRVS